MQKISASWLICTLFLFGAGLFFESIAIAQTSSDTVVSLTKPSKKKKKRSKKKKSSVKKSTVVKDTSKKSIPQKPQKSISLAPPTVMKPTRTGAPGTVKNYFFPDKIGAFWKVRTVRIVLDKDNKIVQADTVFTESKVIDTGKYSLQRLPLMVTSDTSYATGRSGVREESVYYVDDSVAMTVFNNSITHGENRIFLVSPLKLRNAWHEKLEDTTVTMIAGFGDSIQTPIGKLNTVLVTLSQQEYSDMRSYFVPGYGIVKSIFRSVGPNGKGLVIITTEMVEFSVPEEKKK